jgi:hypothetical protein
MRKAGRVYCSSKVRIKERRSYTEGSQNYHEDEGGMTKARMSRNGRKGTKLREMKEGKVQGKEWRNTLSKDGVTVR